LQVEKTRLSKHRVKIHWGRFIISMLVAAVLLIGIGYFVVNTFTDGAARNFLGQWFGEGGIVTVGENGGGADGGGQGSGAGTGEAVNGDKTAYKPEFARFGELYYYENDKLDRYLTYEAEHSEFSADEVVWRVNSGLDKPFYTDVKVIEDVYGLPTLVNKYNKFPDDFEPAELVQIEGGYHVTPDTKRAYEGMSSEASQQGLKLRAGSAYRTIEYQTNLYARYKNEDGEAGADAYSSRPGHSEHHTGRTIDLVGTAGTLKSFVGTAEAEWVAENAHKYGVIVRYTADNEDVTGYMAEPWHITYVGNEAANTMREENIGSLEEYMVKYVYHSK
jgi:D-alanyl-D-alanine carboxypeptidase